MFKVTASSIDGYFAFDPAREAELRAIDRMIRHAAPTLKRWFVAGTPPGEPGMKMAMIGYGRFAYTVRSSPQPIDWPIVGLALQKNYLSLYLSARREGTPLLASYADRLGKVSISKIGAMTFVRTADIDRDAFTDMLRALVVDLDQNRIDLRYGRVKDG
ncbi:DUF1801 domain-containing protein [Reyranella sp. CPCC 100927]|uniref:DUF1801 domain-containing protein n=1 Tax=Reyranella sp. CPCC 100927 TaxID=2599616 RepID=UPI0011B65F88|nr:DUF1801 domain-containing protein [Reyranella sp. CPCC 100927]TWS98308.1 DUF1801 domain-containing protein [Reyranella sp. CPCC 100927]